MRTFLSLLCKSFFGKKAGFPCDFKTFVIFQYYYEEKQRKQGWKLQKLLCNNKH